MKNKLTLTLVAFLFLIPFRLPISILFIRFFEFIIESTTKEVIPDSTLSTNVILTKIVYNIAFSSLFIYNLEMFSREKMNRLAKSKDASGVMSDDPCFWWVVPIAILLLVFIVVDAISVNSVFFSLTK